MSFWKKILLTINVVLVVGLLLAYLSPSTDPNTNSMYAFFGIFYPVLLLGNLFIMLVWIFADYRFIFLSLVAIALGWNHLTGFVNISGPPVANDELRIMSYNLASGFQIRDKSKKKQEQNAQLFANYLEGIAQPTIICLQESNAFLKNIFSAKFPDYHLHDIAHKGAIIYSKHPIVNGGNIEFGTRTNSCVYADVVIKGDTLRVYNMHLQSNKISKEASTVMESADLNEPETWERIKGILGKYKTASKIRSKQAKKVNAHAKSSPYPTILSGDVNDPPTSYTYQMLSEGRQDAFHVKGSGIGTTYGGSIPMLRIDYFFVDPSLEVSAYNCRKETFSDHYPIFADIKL